MAFLSLSGDEQGILFTQLCNVLEPRTAVFLSGACGELWALTEVLRQQLRADHEVAVAFCRQVGMRSCKELREAKVLDLGQGIQAPDFTAADLTTLGTLGSVLPALEFLHLWESAATAGLDGVQRLMEGLGAGALPALKDLCIADWPVGDAGASALAAALGQGAMPRLENLQLLDVEIGDAGLVALAPALRRRPALTTLFLEGNPVGDEGLAALVGTPPLPTGGLKKLSTLDLSGTQVTDAGCATLIAALDDGTLPALWCVHLDGFSICASSAAKNAVYEAMRRAGRDSPNVS